MLESLERLSNPYHAVPYWSQHCHTPPRRVVGKLLHSPTRRLQLSTQHQATEPSPTEPDHASLRLSEVLKHSRPVPCIRTPNPAEERIKYLSRELDSLDPDSALQWASKLNLTEASTKDWRSISLRPEADGSVTHNTGHRVSEPDFIKELPISSFLTHQAGHASDYRNVGRLFRVSQPLHDSTILESTTHCYREEQRLVGESLCSPTRTEP